MISLLRKARNQLRKRQSKKNHLKEVGHKKIHNLVRNILLHVFSDSNNVLKIQHFLDNNKSTASLPGFHYYNDLSALMYEQNNSFD